nr:hypothetical protein [Campylobacter sp.]
SQDYATQNTKELYKELASRYTNLNFFGVGKMDKNAGFNSIAIAPNILNQMLNNPEKRQEFQALIYDINNLPKMEKTLTGDKIIASGYFINPDGTAGMWIISESNNENDNKSLIEKILEELKEKQNARNALKNDILDDTTNEKMSKFSTKLNLKI